MPRTTLLALCLERVLSAARYVRDHYRDPQAWGALLVSIMVLAYAGGGVMFWFHAIYLGEGGPPISLAAHWLLDSTVGLVGLSLPLAVILPGAAWVAERYRRPGQEADPWLVALAAGVAFALVTAPAPMIHDLFVGRGTWLAAQATRLFGRIPEPYLREPVDVPWFLDGLMQVAAGLPTYVLLAWVAAHLWRLLSTFGRVVRRAPADSR